MLSLLKKSPKDQQRQLEQKLRFYRLDPVPFFLLSNEDRDLKKRELSVLLANAEEGYLYVSREPGTYEFGGSKFNIINNVYILATRKELNLPQAEGLSRPIIVREYAKHLQTNEGYARVLVSYSYSTIVPEGALSLLSLKNVPKRLEIVVQFKKLDTAKVRGYLTSLDLKYQRMRAYASSSVQVEQMLATSQQLKLEIDQLAATPMQFRFLFIVHTNTLNELDAISKELIQATQQLGILIEPPCCAQKELYEFEGNVGYRISSNVSLSKFYPLAGLQVLEQDGIFLGVDDKGNPIQINYFMAVNGRTNPHWIVTGTTGAGKTTTVSAIIDRSLRVYKDIYIIVIDPMSNFNRFFESVADLNKVFDEDTYLGLDPLPLIKEGLVAPGNIADFIAENYGIPGELRGLLTSQLEKYASLQELLDSLESMSKKKSATEYRRLYNYLINMVSGTDKYVFTGEKIDLSNKRFIILGLKTEDARKKRLASAMLLFYAYSLINRLPRDVKKIIIIDEAHFLLESPAIANLIAIIYRTARALRTSMITITQLIQHFTVNQYAREVFQLASNRLILKQERESVNDLRELAKLSDEEIEYIIKAGRGEGVLFSGQLRSRIKIMLTEDEKQRWRTE